MNPFLTLAFAGAFLTTGMSAFGGDTANTLVAEIRAGLPAGWSVNLSQSSGQIEITRDAEVLGFSTDDVPGQDEKPRMRSYGIVFRVMDVAAGEKISDYRTEAQELDAQIQTLYDGLVARAIPRVFENFIPRNDVEKKLVYRLGDLRSARARVPDFFVDGHPVIWILNGPSRQTTAVINDKERDECSLIQSATNAILMEHSNARSSSTHGDRPAN